MKLIGLSGAAGAGKDTLANFLVEHHGYTRLAFADAVREAALALDPIIVTESTVYVNTEGVPYPIDHRLSEIVSTYGWDKAKREFTEVRRILQVLGTEVGRQILGANCWVDILIQKMRDIMFSKNVDKFVITDMRFPNEVEFIHGSGGKTVRIIRENNPNAIPATHASETYQFEPDLTIVNNGSLDVLRTNAHALALMMEGITKW